MIDIEVDIECRTNTKILIMIPIHTKELASELMISQKRFSYTFTKNIINPRDEN